MKQKILIAAGLLLIATASFAFVMRDSAPDEKECTPKAECSVEMPACCQGSN